MVTPIPPTRTVSVVDVQSLPPPGVAIATPQRSQTDKWKAESNVLVIQSARSIPHTIESPDGSSTPSDFVCDIVADFIKAHFSVVFGYQGGAITPLISALCRLDDRLYLSNRNESAAGLSAAALAKLNHKPSCVVVTSGPGVSQLLNGIIDANHDGCPILVVSGRAANLDYEEFQGGDIRGVYVSAGIETFTVEKKQDTWPLLTKAWKVCLNNRCAHLIVPKHVWEERVPRIIVTEPSKTSNASLMANPDALRSDIDSILVAHDSLLNTPPFVIVIGCKGVQFATRIMRVAELVNAPILTRLDGKGCIPEDDMLCHGVVGIHGSVGHENARDLLTRFTACLCFGDFDAQTIRRGMRHDSSQTVVRFGKGGTPLNDANIERFTVELEDKLRRMAFAKSSPLLRVEPAYSPLTGQPVRDDCVVVPDLMANLSKMIRDNDTLCIDTGDVTLWTSDFLRIARKDGRPLQNVRVLTSEHFGTMGYSIAAAVACVASSKQQGDSSRTFVFVGDGAFQMTMPELATIRQLRYAEKHPVIVILLDNGILSRVKHYMPGETQAGCDLDGPNLEKIAEAYDFKYVRVTEATQVRDIKPRQNTLVHVIQDPNVPAFMYHARTVDHRHLGGRL